MKEICIHIPELAPHDTVDVEVTLNGVKRVMNYRVETIPWSHSPVDQSGIEALRSFIASYDAAWELVQIGVPGTDRRVPLMFRRREPADATS